MEYIKTYNETFSIPTSWDDLTGQQFLNLIELMIDYDSQNEVKTMFLFSVLNMSWKKFVALNVFAVGEIIHDYFKFISTEPKFKNNPLQVIQLGISKYLAPAPELSDFTFQQFFEYTEQYFSAYLKTENEQYLNLLCASAYIASKKGMKSEFWTYNTEAHAAIFAKSHLHIRKAIMLAYLSDRSKLVAKYPKLFKASKSTSGSFYFNQLLDSLNTNDLSKNTEIKNSYLHEACVRISNMIKENEKMKQHVQRK